MAPRTTTAGRKINQGNLVHHPTQTDLYIGFVTRHAKAYRGYVFENPRKLHLALRPNPKVLAEPAFNAPTLASCRFRMRAWFEAKDPQAAKLEP